jgi:hypothetical protein
LFEGFNNFVFFKNLMYNSGVSFYYFNYHNGTNGHYSITT